MPAPIGNQFWKLRSKHGRDKIFQTPEMLWEAAQEYFEATDRRKWVKKDWVGKDAIPVERETDTPYTLSGMFVFFDINKTTWDTYRQREDFSAVVARIEQIMNTQKFEGATVGAFNANIIARDLGLREIQDHNINDARKSVSDLFPLQDSQENE